jgi:glycosyltransferase involved in cell wall biosynthesis
VSGNAIAVSVIIPLLDDPARLETCLSALARQSFSRPFEVVVVDNGSADDPARLVGGFGFARLLREPRRSSYAARNRGVRAARGQVLAFTDSDCIPAEDWLERGHARVMALDEPAFVAGRIEVFPRDAGATTTAERYELLHGFPQRRFAEELHFAATANLLVSRDALAQVGEFSDELISSGDREWGQRAADRGVAAVYADDAAVRHPARRSLAELTGKARRLQIGESQLRGLRGESIGLRALLRPFVRPPVRAIAANVSRVQPPTLGAKAQYAAFALFLFYFSSVQRISVACRDGVRGRMLAP